MRKILSVLLCAAIFISILFVNTSAVEGTAINSAADFAAMDPDGVYYLNADIKIDITYEKAFTGTFDGNGRTVTVTVPMFAQFEGTVKNLTIDGVEISGKEDLAAFAVYTYDGMTAINVINKVDITVTGISDDKASGLNAGGILANADVASMSVFRNCINYGKITVETAEVQNTSTGAQYETHAGGIVGRADGLEAKYCENHGEISAPSINGQAGGIVARAVYNAALMTCDIVDCTNTADISSGLDAGGMAGNIGLGNNNIYQPYTITYCVNTGNISGGYRAGGFVGYCYSSGANLTYYLEIMYSVTVGDVKGGRPAANLAGSAQYSYISLFVGYSNSVYNSIVGCLAVGELGAIQGDNFVTPFYCIMGCSSAKTADMVLENNYILDNDTTVWYSYATAEANISQQIPITYAIDTGRVTRCTADELKSGLILDKLNAAAGSPIFTQTFGTDAYPTIDLTLREKRASEDSSITEETTTVQTTPPVVDVTTKVTDEITTAPIGDVTTAPPTAITTAPTTTADKPDKTSGCGSAVVSGIAIVAILGGAVLLGKKD